MDAVQIPDVISRMTQWIDERQAGNYIAVTGMHGVMEAQQSRLFKAVLNGASWLWRMGCRWFGSGKSADFHCDAEFMVRNSWKRSAG